MNRHKSIILFIICLILISIVKVYACPNDPPYAVISGSDPSYHAVGTLVHFYGSSSWDDNDSLEDLEFEWNFGDGHTGENAATSHTYATAGTYYVSLKVTDSMGAYDIENNWLHVIGVEIQTPSSYAVNVSVPLALSCIPLDTTGGTFSWSGGGNFTENNTTSANNTNFSSLVPGAYGVGVTYSVEGVTVSDTLLDPIIVCSALISGSVSSGSGTPGSVLTYSFYGIPGTSVSWSIMCGGSVVAYGTGVIPAGGLYSFSGPAETSGVYSSSVSPISLGAPPDITIVGVSSISMGGETISESVAISPGTAPVITASPTPGFSFPEVLEWSLTGPGIPPGEPIEDESTLSGEITLPTLTTPGEYELTITCGTESVTIDIVIVDVASVTYPSGGSSITYVGGSIDLLALSDPSGYAFPEELSWEVSGPSSEADIETTSNGIATVTGLNVPGEYTVTVTCGSNDSTPTTTKIYAVGVAKIKDVDVYSGNDGGAENTLYVPLGPQPFTDLYIKFQQYDNWPVISDGREFDNILVKAGTEVLYQQDFSAGKPSTNWTYYSNSQGQIQVVGGKLRLDDSVGDVTYSLNEAILHLDITGKKDITLTVDHKKTFGEGYADEDHGLPSELVNHLNGDGIFTSIDGIHWVKESGLSVDFTASTFILDLEKAASFYPIDLIAKPTYQYTFPASPTWTKNPTSLGLTPWNPNYAEKVAVSNLSIGTDYTVTAKCGSSDPGDNIILKPFGVQITTPSSEQASCIINEATQLECTHLGITGGTYTWSATGPSGATITFNPNPPNTSNPTFMANQPGDYTVTVAYTLGGKTAYDSCKITVVSLESVELELEFDVIEGLYAVDQYSQGFYSPGYTSSDNKGRIYSNRVFTSSNENNPIWIKDRQYIDIKVKIMPEGVMLPTNAKIVWEEEDTDDLTDNIVDDLDLKEYIDPTDFDNSDNDSDGIIDEYDEVHDGVDNNGNGVIDEEGEDGVGEGNDNKGDRENPTSPGTDLPTWEAVPGKGYTVSVNETEVHASGSENNVSWIRFNATDVGGDNFKVKAKLKIGSNFITGAEVQTGVMTIWKLIYLEYAKMAVAYDLPVDQLALSFDPAFVEFFPWERQVLDYKIYYQTPPPDPIETFVMALNNEDPDYLGYAACSDYVTKANGQFSNEHVPGWFFVAAAHNFIPTLGGTQLYPPQSSGFTKGWAYSDGFNRIELLCDLPPSSTPDALYIFEPTETYPYPVYYKVLGYDSATYRLTLDYHYYQNPTNPAYSAYNLGNYGFLNSGSVADTLVHVRSAGSYGIAGRSPMPGRTIVFTKHIGNDQTEMLTVLVHELVHAFGLTHRCGNPDYSSFPNNPNWKACPMCYPDDFLLQPSSTSIPTGSAIPWTNNNLGTKLCIKHIQAIRETKLENILNDLEWFIP